MTTTIPPTAIPRCDPVMHARGKFTIRSCCGASSNGREAMNSSGRKGADDGLLLKAFGTLPRRNLKSVADQDRCLADLSGKGPHLQRETGVTEADSAVRPEQEGELILNAIHGIYAFITGSRRTQPASTLGSSVAGGGTVA